MTAPALHAYVVTLCFAGAEQNGPVHTSVILAPDQTAAAALVMHTLMREQPTELPLTCCIATQIEAAYLRHLLRAVEGKLPENGTAEVLSLVQKPAPAEDDPRKFLSGGILIRAALDAPAPGDAA